MYRNGVLLSLEVGPLFMKKPEQVGRLWSLMGPGFARSVYQLFLYPKKHLAGQNVHDGDEIKIEIEMWFR